MTSKFYPQKCVFWGGKRAFLDANWTFFDDFWTQIGHFRTKKAVKITFFENSCRNILILKLISLTLQCQIKRERYEVQRTTPKTARHRLRATEKAKVWPPVMVQPDYRQDVHHKQPPDGRGQAGDTKVNQAGFGVTITPISRCQETR